MTILNSKKRSTLIPHAWFKALEKLPDDVAGRIYKAVQRLDITGKMTIFEEGSIEDVLFSQYAFQTEEFGQNYAQTCENKSQAAKKREEKKKAQKAQQGTAEPQANSSVDDRSGVDVSGGDVSGVDDSAPQDTTTTTAPDFDEILMAWNNQPVTRPIIKIGDSGKRHDRTEMAVAVAGGQGPFLNAIRSLKDQAYFRNRQKDGYKVEYDWFVDPENFQNVLEGKYEKSRDKFGDGWEVVEFG